MTNTVTKNSPFKFISFDAEDADGVRAEIIVQVNKGTIKEVKTEKADKGFVDVHFNVPGLNFPIHGWIAVNSPVYSLVETARDNNEEITFRIETQRKKGINPSIPMSELRADTATAQKSVRTVLVGINGVYTDELMTNPEEDAALIGDRRPATSGSSNGSASKGGSTVNVANRLENLKKIIAEGGVRSSVLDAMVAQLLLDGVPAEEAHQIVAGADKRDVSRPSQQSSFSVEAPSWKDYNSDGRPNLGSGVVAASVGIETLLAEQFRELLVENNVEKVSNYDDTVAYYLNILLAICDRVQMLSYGEGFRPDRAASSHTRIRGIIYELIKKETSLPVDVVTGDNGDTVFRYNEKKHITWVKFLGETGVVRFRRAVEAAFSYPGFKAAIPSSLLNGVAPSVAPVSTPVEQTPAPVETAPEPAPEAVEEPTYDAPPVESVPEPEAETHIVVEASTIATTVDTNSFYPMQTLTEEQVEGEEKATVATLKSLAKLFEGSGFNLKDQADMSRVAELLGMTFGAEYSNPRNIPNDLLEDFIDHYESYGVDVLHAAISYAHAQPVGAA